MTVVFGGTVGFTYPLGIPTAVLSLATWEWDGAVWTRRFPRHSPSARGRHTMAWDGNGQGVVLFGGIDAGGVRGDLWHWNGTDWTDVTPQSGPTPRSDAAMGWDGRRTILTGGDPFDRGTASDETWYWANETWTRGPAVYASAGVRQHAMARSPHGMLLVGGKTDLGPNLHTWRLQDGRWSIVDSANLDERDRPAGERVYGSLSWDGQQTLLFGGEHPDTGDLYGQLWRWDGGEWLRLPTTQDLPARRFHTLSRAEGGVLLVGGVTSVGRLRTFAEPHRLLRVASYPLQDRTVNVNALLEFEARAHGVGELHHEVVNLPPGATYDPNNGQFSWRPTPQDTGRHHVTFNATGILGGASETVQIDVVDTNQVPVALGARLEGTEDQVFEVLLTASDDDDDLIFRVTRPPQFGQLAGQPPQLLYQPNQDANGADSFEFTASDGRRTSEPATVELFLASVNDAPRPVTVAATTFEDTPFGVTLLAHDPEADPVSWSLETAPAQGDATLVGNLLTYAPHQDFSGRDEVDLEVSDGFSSRPVTLSIEVLPLNDPPTLLPVRPVVTQRNRDVSIPTVASDVDGDPSLLILVPHLPEPPSWMA